MLKVDRGLLGYFWKSDEFKSYQEILKNIKQHIDGQQEKLVGDNLMSLSK